MEELKELSCIDCTVKACSGKGGTHPAFCISQKVEEEDLTYAKKKYMEEDNHKVMIASAEVEFEKYCEITRLEELIIWARKMEAKKIGIATCVGLLKESRILAKVLRERGFEVYGVGCKVGEIPKTDLGISKDCTKIGGNSCNPILQAELLNKSGTDINVVMGLCVGHDSLFYKYSEAPTTTLVAKDRVLGHNPVAALYTADTYYANKIKNS